VNPDHHRPRFGGFSRRPDIQEQTVLALLLSATLHADRAGRRGVPHALPGHDRRRWPPAQVSNRRRGEGNALERYDLGSLVGDGTSYLTTGHRHRCVGREHRHGGGRLMRRRRTSSNYRERNEPATRPRATCHLREFLSGGTSCRRLGNIPSYGQAKKSGTSRGSAGSPCGFVTVRRRFVDKSMTVISNPSVVVPDAGVAFIANPNWPLALH
jgi:hypothetical protein